MANYLPNNTVVTFNELDFFRPITGIEISTESFTLNCFLDNGDTIESINDYLDSEEVYRVVINTNYGFIFSGNFICEDYKIYLGLDEVARIDFIFIRED